LGQNKGQTFMHGALILVLSNILVKVIGALFKIPLARLLNEEGMAIFNTAYQVYAALFAISTTGLPIAISKMVAENMAQKNVEMCRRIFKVSFLLLGILGLAGSLVLYVFAPYIASMIRDTAATYSMIAISPALFFICIASCYRGFFQGMLNMKPTAISQVIEALGKLMLGYGIAYVLMRYAKISAAESQKELVYDWPAAGAVLGITLGIIVSAFYLSFRYLSFVRKKGYTELDDGHKKRVLSHLTITKNLIFIAVPITLGACVSSITALVDTAMIRGRLQDIIFTKETAERLYNLCHIAIYDRNHVFSNFLQTLTLGEKQARWLYGSYSGYAYPLFNLPSTIVLALSMSIVPAISAALASGDTWRAQKTVQSVIRITLIFSLPCSVALIMCAEPMLRLLYHNISSAMLLKLMAPACVAITLVSVTTAILQAAGHVMIPVRNMLLGGIIKVICNYFLIGNAYFGIFGAPIGTLVCYFFIAICNLMAVKKTLHVSFDVRQSVIRPLAASLLMGACLWVFGKFGFWQEGTSSLVTIGLLGINGIFYIIFLLIVKGMVKKDIEMLPKGKNIVKVLAKYKIID